MVNQRGWAAHQPALASVVSIGHKTSMMNYNQKQWPSFPGSQIIPGYGSSQWHVKTEGAKNHRVSGLGCLSMTTLATYNCRSLSTEGRLQEIEEELDKIRWDIVGLSEVRRKGEEMIELKSGHILYYRGTDNGRTSGVGFIINKKLKNNIVEIESSSDRIARIVIQLSKRYQMQIIQVYAPTISYSDEEVEEFYEELQKLHHKGKQHIKIIMGDFNARIGKWQQDEKSVGKYGYGQRNERGHRLVEFAESENLFIINSCFKKNPRRKWTWKSPNGGTSEVDYILTNRKYIFQDCNVLNRFNTGSDHRMVRSKMYLNIKSERKKLLKVTKETAVDMVNLRKNASEFKLELHNRFTELENLVENEVGVNEMNKEFTETVMKSAISTAGMQKQQCHKKISEETKKLMCKRREMKMKKDDPMSRVEYAELCKTVRKCITEDVRRYNCDLVKKAIEENRSLKVAKRDIGVGRKIITSLKRGDGIVTRNQDEIIKIIEKFYCKLYKMEEKSIGETHAANTAELPPVLKEEVAFAIKCMKKGKAPGCDRITLDILREAGNEIEAPLAKLFTKCLYQKDVPEDWKNALVILLFKKGDRADIGNYRPISLLSVLYKVFTKVIVNRLQKALDSAQTREQAGFRSGYSTMDHIHVLREVIERANEYAIPLCIGFIDFEKAFDSVYISSVIEALNTHDIEPGYIELIKNTYRNATSTIRLHKSTNKIKIEKGVRQGDTISPKLFTAVLQEVFKKLCWEEKGIRINGEYLSHLKFADDIIVLASDGTELQNMINELSEESVKVGLKMNLKKTKVMFNEFVKQQKIHVREVELEEVGSYVYLGQEISMDGSIMNEINHRVKLGWKAFGRNNLILKGNMPLCLKRKVFNQCILPVLTYGSETWTLSAKAIQKLQTTQRSMERCMLGITRRDRKRNTWVREQTKVRDIVTSIKRLKWKWAGHVSRRIDDRWTLKILDWIPRDKARPRKRPHRRWVDEITKVAGVNWKARARDRTGWRVLGETYILQWIDNGCK